MEEIKTALECDILADPVTVCNVTQISANQLEVHTVSGKYFRITIEELPLPTV